MLSEEAARAQSDSICWTQHLLIGLAEEGTNDAALCLKNRGISAANIRAKAFELFPLQERDSHQQLSTRVTKSEHVKQVLIRASEFANKVINAEHLMLGLLQAPDTPDDKTFNSTVILRAMGVDIEIFKEDLKDFQRTAPQPSLAAELEQVRKQTLIAEPTFSQTADRKDSKAMKSGTGWGPIEELAYVVYKQWRQLIQLATFSQQATPFKTRNISWTPKPR